MNLYHRLLPWVVVACGAVFLLFKMLPPPGNEESMRLDDFGRLPVVEGGRTKPMDTVARTTLMSFCGRQECEFGEDDKRPAIRWLLDVMTSSKQDPGKLNDQKVFTIKDPQLVELLGLAPRSDGRYSYHDIVDQGAKSSAAFGTRWKEAAAKDAGDRSEFDKAVVELGSHIQLASQLGPIAMRYRAFGIDDEAVLGLVGLKPRSGLRYAAEEIAPRMADLEREAAHADAKDEKQRDKFESKTLELYSHIQLYIKLATLETPLIVPPTATSEKDKWETFARAEAQAENFMQAAIGMMRERMGANNPEVAKLRDDELLARMGPQLDRFINPAVRSYARLFDAYAHNEAKAFNHELEDYDKLLDKQMPTQVSKANFEAFFNHFAPFYQCGVLYSFVFVLGCVAWLWLPQPLTRSAFWLAVLTLVVHTWGLFARMYMLDRPLVMVTNLYSSAVFIGWMSVIVGLILEAIFRNGIGVVTAAALGGLTMIVAHNLALVSGDTLEMMRAVLDTNFWLATHVTCITIGYSATIIAGFLGILFIIRGVLTPSLDRDTSRSLSQMIYGIVCFATLFSFVGTVLGGIWADQSWGRFWGWDSKENGALLIVVMNALTLHARWAGLVKQRGMAVLAVVGNIIVAWSWFGTNQLGVGLHAYGFNDKLSFWLDIFWLSQLGVIALGLVPQRHWLSFKRPVQPVAAGKAKLSPAR